ncbi:SPOR domain-containing protein [Thiorhodococcus fuscus]|uniref:SPOR domain-containing protein n=1 Tax=Thiorhodococcus fuscus TaxID=527200 RepID=A0ABW4YDD5_9GAMM
MASTATETPNAPAEESEPGVQEPRVAKTTSPPEAAEIESVPAPPTQTAPEVATQTVPTETEPLAEQTESSVETGSETRAETPPRYRWHVQLLAGRSLEKVEIDRALFIRHYGAMLKGLTLTISQSSYGDARDAFHRLRAEEWTDEAEARRWCAQLRAQGHQCLVTRVTRPDAPARGTPE